MKELTTKLEKELFLFIQVYEIYGFRADINESLEISSKTLQRYVKELNDNHLFRSPIKYDFTGSKEYNLKSFQEFDDHDYYEVFENDIDNFQLSFCEDDTPHQTHLKRLAALYYEYRNEFFYYTSDDFFEDEDRSIKAPSILKTMQEKYPSMNISVRSIERDIKIILKVLSLYYKNF